MFDWFRRGRARGAIGIYGVMFYTVQQRQRDIGICRAIGAQAGDIVVGLARRIVIVVVAGTTAGLGLGLFVVRYLVTLFYGVHATDVRQLAEPALAIGVVGILAALPPMLRALRVSPTMVLRGE